ncbi:hypothetical protein KC19_VG219900 [Ceratodon purpureus]|uniref:AP2/ERF domain-containing protein n=1 Tax=Ceratodon purpureus TaxID=3225 RepID=A0A8T0HSG2_CERPU|nr:hypothetical protein KC19_VG219900 [Ceratodon purpureus]
MEEAKMKEEVETMVTEEVAEMIAGGEKEGKKKKKSKWGKLSSVTSVWKTFKEGYYKLRIKHFENLISVGLPGEVNLIMFEEIPEKPKPPPRFKGVRQLEKTKRWVSEIRPTVGLYTNQKKKKIWLGSFGTPEEAARAFDVGVYLWKDDQGLENFNFPDSPEFLKVLEPNRDTLDEKTRCSRTKALAQRAADRAAAQRDFEEITGSRRRDTRGEGQTRSA